MKNRAFVFIDGNNWYHSLRNAGIRRPGNLKIARVCEKLIGLGRMWTGTRYYVGRVNQTEEPHLYAEQRRYELKVESEDPRIKFFYGRLERRPNH